MSKEKKFVVSPLRMEDMLRWTSANGYMDMVKIEFGKDGAKVRQMDNTSIVAVFADFKKTYFTKYKNIGTITLEVSSILKGFSKMFKKDNDITVIVDDNNITFEGSSEIISKKLMSNDLTTVKWLSFETEVNEYGIFKKGSDDPDKVFVVDAANLKSIPDCDELIFDYDKDGVSVIIKDELGFMKKKLDLVVNKGDKSGQIKLSGKIFKKLVSSLRGPVTITLTENAPVTITTRVPKTDEFIVTYYIAIMTDDTPDEDNEETEEEDEDEEE